MALNTDYINHADFNFYFSLNCADTWQIFKLEMTCILKHFTGNTYTLNIFVLIFTFLK